MSGNHKTRPLSWILKRKLKEVQTMIEQNDFMEFLYPSENNQEEIEYGNKLEKRRKDLLRCIDIIENDKSLNIRFNLKDYDGIKDISVTSLIENIFKRRRVN